VSNAAGHVSTIRDDRPDLYDCRGAAFRRPWSGRAVVPPRAGEPAISVEVTLLSVFGPQTGWVVAAVALVVLCAAVGLALWMRRRG